MFTSFSSLLRKPLLSKMLWAFSSINFLRENFVFKGGTALRKFYFPSWRYSEDLDFSSTAAVWLNRSSFIVPSQDPISENLKQAQTLLMDEFGLSLEPGKPHVVLREVRKRTTGRDEDDSLAYIEYTIKYTGPLQKSSNVKSAKTKSWRPSP